MGLVYIVLPRIHFTDAIAASLQPSGLILSGIVFLSPALRLYETFVVDLACRTDLQVITDGRVLIANV